MKKGKQRNRNLLALICEILLTISICLGIAYNAYYNLALQTKNYSAEIESDYATLTNNYIRTFQVIKMESEEKIREDLSFDEMQNWLLTRDSIYRDAIGDDVFDGFAYTYKGGYVHSWNYGDYSEYVPASRPWYQTAEKADGEVAVVAPYVTFLSNTSLIEDYDILRMSIVQKYDDDISFDFDLNVSEINNLIANRNTLYQGTFSLLYDKDGYILSSTDSSMYGHNVNTPDQEISENLSTILTKRVTTNNQMRMRMVDGKLKMVYMYKDNTQKTICMLIPFGEVFINNFLFVLLLALILMTIEILFYVQNKIHLNNLVEANHAKSNFLSRMSHELRTPLNALNGYSLLIKDNIRSDHPDTKLQLENITYIERASKYLLRIIEDILDIQNSTFGSLHIQKEVVDAESYMKNIVEMVSMEAEAKGIHFTFKRLTNMSREYMLDGVRFQQVLLNVLHNAIKFTPAGGTVSMTAEAVDQNEDTTTIEFVVTDTGIGMSPDFVKNKLFTNFSQENQSIDSPYEGCGIGMCISKQLLDLMGGTISCVSEKGKGTTFTITITTEHVKENKRRSTRKKDYQEYDLSGVKVLLCEDNQMNQDMERRILERMKCEVEIAEDGQVGLDKFIASAENEFDIILMDIRMPNLDGWEAAKAIRALSRADAKTVPIVAVSANAFKEDVDNSLEVGMNEHLAKPVDARVLYEKITRYCKKNI